MPKKPIKEEESIPMAEPYQPKDTDDIARVFIIENSVTAYKQPVVDKPVNPYPDSKVYNKENYPAQPGTKLPNPFPELPEKSKSYLKLWPYGSNIVINKKQVSKLMNFYMDMANTPLPSHVHEKFQEHMRLLREMLNLCSVEDNDSKWAEITKESRPTFPKYVCKCNNKTGKK